MGFWNLRPLSLLYLPGSLGPVSLVPLSLHLRALGKGPRRAQCPDVLMGCSKDNKGPACCGGRPAWLPASQEAAGGLRVAVGSLGAARSKQGDPAGTYTINVHTQSSVRTFPVDQAGPLPRKGWGT